MSWVAPVVLEQSVQYANRMVTYKNDYAELSKASAVSLNSQFVEEERRGDQRRFANILQAVKKKEMKQAKFPFPGGKGLTINEYI
ncbi:hypothetical protein GJU40_06970 [Bacillus lacus]|uniref:Uncharacterized protein n=1 Tax=Metabacillus lacus TaxID=1983721 RepID=A0A7X2LZN8_9BACI|nr:hypothetical protein [Metabacillus lacus]MRX71914.1 hypothetical protein [Metabacillus lacus]